MIKYLICLLWGHGWAGKRPLTSDEVKKLGMSNDDAFIYVQRPFCPRCGKPNPHVRS